MRIDLTDENTRKVREAEKQLLERHGITISPNQIVNIAIAAIEQLELQQITTVTMKPSTAVTASGRPGKQKIIRKTTNWVMKL